MTIEAMKQALEALDAPSSPMLRIIQEEAITSLRQAIEQAEKQEPTEDMVLALRGASGLGTEDAIDALRDVLAVMPLYTTPQPQREWVGLTDEDEIDWDGGDLKSLVKAIEAKLRSKNT